MFSREKSLDHLFELFERPAASRAEVIERALRCALELADADGAVLLAANNRALERWTQLKDAPAPHAVRAQRPTSEFGRSLMRGTRPVQLVDGANDGRVSADELCPNVNAGPALFVPLHHRQQSGGYLAIFRDREREPFGAEAIRVAAFLGAWLGLALDNLRLAESVERLAVTDDLTQVYNYRFLKSALRREIKRAGRYRQDLAIIMVDVDNLKAYNDRNGHMRGSLLLREIAGLFVEQVRSWDLVAKYGGDEFTMILPQTGRDGACAAAERIRAAVEAHTFPLATPGQITISLGVAVFPEDALDAASLIRASDTALYDAKRGGRNRVGAGRAAA